jgi:peptidoglycan biosynthesis protein MviN/MurJ (putative lipid II flippase)
MLPNALVARPLASAQLRHLAQAFHDKDMAAFRATYLAARRLALFVAVPASLVMAAVPETVARAVAFGKMDTPAAIHLVSLCISGMALVTVGETMETIAASACYARHDTRSPVVGMTIRLLIAGIGTAVTALAFEGPQRLWIVGGVAAAANIVDSTYMHFALTRALGKRDAGVSGLGAIILISAAAVVPAYLIASWFGDAQAGFAYDAGVAMAALAASVATYVLLNFLRGSEELSLILPFIRRSSSARVQPAWRKS